ncbi:MAG: phosphoethanolamine--lipid A transferase [Burkholderiaceae bacterium]|nr:phosphoethanolamine--lipid A transferase [Burkholderiaceae bacterium]
MQIKTFRLSFYSSPWKLVLLASVWIALFANWPLWKAMANLPEMGQSRGIFFITAFALMVAALLSALLSLVAWHSTVKPVIALFLLAAALGAYFMGTYGVVIDSSMMVNVLVTDWREVRDLLSLRLLLSVLFLAGLPLIFLWQVKFEPAKLSQQLTRNFLVLAGSLTLVLIIGLLSFADLSSTMRNHRSLRYMINPLNSFYAVGMLIHEANAIPNKPPAIIDTTAKLLPRSAKTKPLLLLLVVGETARADHFSLNAYPRATNPELAQQDVMSFRNVSSCGTNTATSLPCMLSHLGRKDFVARQQEYENLLDLLQQTGLAVFWLENQAGCKEVCDRIPHGFAKHPPKGIQHAAGVCEEGECLDEALLTGLDARLASLPQVRRNQGVVLVLHQMGSHGPAYYKRSPPTHKPFQPECKTNVLQNCPPQQIINAFDNSIVYTDYLLSRGIDWLSKQQANYEPAMLYLSDHGESLGENNIYLHGLPYALAPKEQKHVPMIFWLPPSTRVSKGIDYDCLHHKLDEPLSHDNLFHTVVGLVGIQTKAYQTSLDILHSCRSR